MKGQPPKGENKMKIKYVKYHSTNTWHELYIEDELNFGTNCNGSWKSYHFTDKANELIEIPKGSKLCKKCFSWLSEEQKKEYKLV